MREIPLTRGYVALVDDADYEWLSGYAWYAHFNAGRKVYARTGAVTGRRGPVFMHNMILGNPPGRTDHRNRNGLDNRRENLRTCTQRQNVANTVRARVKSPFRGVTIRGGGVHCWRAQIESNGKSIYLGHFATSIQAALAYDAAALNHYGEFAVLNFPDRGQAA